MIQYETAPSPFFEANKAQVESIERQLNALKAEYSGFCSSYGYDIVAAFQKDQRNWHIQLIKSQTKKNGVIIPQNSTDHFETTVTITGLKNTITFSMGRSFFNWIFPSALLPSPYYLRINSTDEAYIEHLAVISQLYEPRSLKQTSEQLTGKLKFQLTDLDDLIENLESLFA